MLRRAWLVVLGLTMAPLPGCSSGGEEGACFLPGEACDGTLCGQIAFCLRDAGPPTCVAARTNGAPCTRDAECFGSCAGGICTGDPRPCPRF
jgi:Dickkopf N-terminal cysteine-rich region